MLLLVSPATRASGSLFAIIFALMTASCLFDAAITPLHTEMDVRKTAVAATPRAKRIGGPYTRVEALDDVDSA
ncbi:hypothetical protein PC112_g13541 [Phytophthora cactorum]|uniref:Uncharacterized protein n=1 Tax=Phytophthora cactorum TaxID=29920 RepID=A0A8T1CIB4_9STRA|nr:hypothetical protein PC112_g13541 [Phytophthora cactorum]KAG2922484.1 hypothetical protein PC117_g15952 [Phytophthora cactorum]KAG3149514.1 hypothetical protein C6341_g17012 [Phytophthora cactorum]